MIEITDGFTSISAGNDRVFQPTGHPYVARSPTGARVTVEFCRETALVPGETVRVRYEFAGDGCRHTATGIARATHSVVRSGCAVVYHYRISHWIEPDAITLFLAGSVGQRTDRGELRGHASL